MYKISRNIEYMYCFLDGHVFGLINTDTCKHLLREQVNITNGICITCRCTSTT